MRGYEKLVSKEFHNILRTYFCRDIVHVYGFILWHSSVLSSCMDMEFRILAMGGYRLPDHINVIGIYRYRIDRFLGAFRSIGELNGYTVKFII